MDHTIIQNLQSIDKFARKFVYYDEQLTDPTTKKLRKIPILYKLRRLHLDYDN